MTRKQRRLTIIGLCGGVLALAAALVLVALQDRIVYFSAPSDLAAEAATPGQRIRLGGLVKDGSVVRGESETVAFAVTDGAHDVPVTYTGILPDLFREGQGVVTEGTFDAGGTFRADTVLARHDENYMPSEVADALKATGYWQEDQQ